MKVIEDWSHGKDRFELPESAQDLNGTTESDSIVPINEAKINQLDATAFPAEMRTAEKLRGREESKVAYEVGDAEARTHSIVE
eukprot:896724-Karenia_brevis.AAC.1